jgi:2-keto-4-pentenoate hydratase/2-oxohepta-3-ene-1,7-dioic acid hydratase in catechol pathway
LVAIQILKGEEAMAKSAGYTIATYQASDGPRAGLVIDDKVFDAAALTRKPAYASVLGILADWRAADGALRKAAASVGKGSGKRGAKAKSRPLEKTKLLAPVRFPSAIYCAGSNYADHANEMAARDNRPPPPDPHTLGLKAWHFIKAPRAIADPGARVKISGYCEQMDWEVELAAVIGRSAKDVPQDKALSYVAGYTIANDLSARDRGRRANMPDASPFKWDWTKHKTFDGSCPLGPWIVPASDIGDPQKLGLKLWVNGVLEQDSNTSEMIFTLAEQIAQLSAGMTLHPGDVILTGTPAGVGAGRNEFLKAGDTVKLWIEKIGEIENRMV